MKIIESLIICLTAIATLNVQAAPERVRTNQSEHERRIKAVVRNKIHYKKGKIEVTAVGGMLPYDSVISSYAAGARFTWHLSDHLAWEVANGQVFFPSTSNFTSGLLQAHTNITNLQAPRLKTVATTGLIISPLYGKIHVAGRWDLFFDIFISVGLGAANIETVQFASTGGGSPPSETILRKAWDPAANLGIGFKFFVTNGIGLSFELRDYIVYTQSYNSKRLRSYFSTLVGLTLFIPSLG